MGLRDLINGSEVERYNIPYNPELFDTQQSLNSCATNVQHGIIEDILGTDFDEDITSLYAFNNGLIRDIPSAGKFLITPFNNVGRVLTDCGLNVYRFDNPNFEALDSMLENGDAVMIGYQKHIRRLLDYDKDTGILSMVDPEYDTGEPISVNINSLQGTDINAWQVEAPDKFELSAFKDAVDSKILTHDPDDLQIHKISRDLIDNFGPKSENPLGSYDYAGNQAANASPELTEHMTEEISQINLEISNWVATGAFLSVVDYYKDNPKRGKRVTQAAIAIGALDAFTDLGVRPNSGVKVELDFEVNPLLIASLAVYVAQYANFPKGSFRAKFAVISSKYMSRGMKALEYGGYAAIAIEVIDFITDIGLADGILEIIDGLDFLDILPDLADGVSLIDGMASLGLGILASRAIRFLFDKWNKNDIIYLKDLTTKTTPKNTLIELLENGAPPQVLLGAYSADKKQ